MMSSNFQELPAVSSISRAKRDCSFDCSQKSEGISFPDPIVNFFLLCPAMVSRKIINSLFRFSQSEPSLEQGAGWWGAAVGCVGER